MYTSNTTSSNFDRIKTGLHSKRTQRKITKKLSRKTKIKTNKQKFSPFKTVEVRTESNSTLISSQMSYIDSIIVGGNNSPINYSERNKKLHFFKKKRNSPEDSAITRDQSIVGISNPKKAKESPIKMKRNQDKIIENEKELPVNQTLTEIGTNRTNNSVELLLKKRKILNSEGNESIIESDLARVNIDCSLDSSIKITRDNICQEKNITPIDSEMCMVSNSNKNPPSVNKKNMKLSSKLGKHSNKTTEMNMPVKDCSKERILLESDISENIKLTDVNRGSVENINELTNFEVESRKSETNLGGNSSLETGLTYVHTEFSHDKNTEDTSLSKEGTSENQLSREKNTDRIKNSNFVDLNQVHEICTEDLNSQIENSTSQGHKSLFDCCKSPEVSPMKKNKSPLKHHSFNTCTVVKDKDLSIENNDVEENQVFEIPSSQNTVFFLECETAKQQSSIKSNTDIIRNDSVSDYSETPDIFMESLEVEPDNNKLNANYTKISLLDKNKIPKVQRNIKINNPVNDISWELKNSQKFPTSQDDHVLSIQSEINIGSSNNTNESNIKNKTLKTRSLSNTSTDDSKCDSNKGLNKPADCNRADKSLSVTNLLDNHTSPYKTQDNLKNQKDIKGKDTTQFNSNVSSIEVSNDCIQNHNLQNIQNRTGIFDNDVCNFTKISLMRKKKVFQQGKKIISTAVKESILKEYLDLDTNDKISDSKSVIPLTESRKIEIIDSNNMESEELLDSFKNPLLHGDGQPSNEISNNFPHDSSLKSNQITKDLTDSSPNDIYTLTKISPLTKKNKFRQTKTYKTKEPILNKYLDSIENENCTLEPEDRRTDSAEKIIRKQRQSNLSFKNKKNLQKQSNIKTNEEFLKNENHDIENNSNNTEEDTPAISCLKNKQRQSKISTADINNSNNNTEEDTPAISCLKNNQRQSKISTADINNSNNTEEDTPAISCLKNKQRQSKTSTADINNSNNTEEDTPAISCLKNKQRQSKTSTADINNSNNTEEDTPAISCLKNKQRQSKTSTADINNSNNTEEDTPAISCLKNKQRQSKTSTADINNSNNTEEDTPAISCLKNKQRQSKISTADINNSNNTEEDTPAISFLKNNQRQSKISTADINNSNNTEEDTPAISCLKNKQRQSKISTADINNSNNTEEDTPAISCLKNKQRQSKTSTADINNSNNTEEDTPAISCLKNKQRQSKISTADINNSNNTEEDTPAISFLKNKQRQSKISTADINNSNNTEEDTPAISCLKNNQRQSKISTADINNSNNTEEDTPAISCLKNKQHQSKISTADINREVIEQNTCFNIIETPSIVLEENTSNEKPSTNFQTKMNTKNTLCTKQSSFNDNFNKDNYMFDSSRGSTDTLHTDSEVEFPLRENSSSVTDSSILAASSKMSDYFHNLPLKERLQDNSQESNSSSEFNKDKCDNVRENNKKGSKIVLSIVPSPKRKTKIAKRSRKNRVYSYSKPTLSSSCSDEENNSQNLALSESSVDLDMNQIPKRFKKSFNLSNSEKIVQEEENLNETNMDEQGYVVSDEVSMINNKDNNNQSINKKTSSKTKSREKPYRVNDSQYKKIIKKKQCIMKQILKENLFGSEAEYQFTHSQKSKNKKPSICTSTPIVQQKSGINQGIKNIKHSTPSSSTSASTSTCGQFKVSSRKSHSVLRTANDSKEEIQSTFICSEDELDMVEGLDIDIDWKLPKLHTIGSESPNKSVAILQRSLCQEDGPIDLKPYTDYEEEKIKRNWEKFCRIYGFRSPDLFVSSDLFNKCISKSNRLKFQQFLARGLPNRRLSSVYAMFKEFSIAAPRRWNPIEDKILLEIHRLYNNPDEYSAVCNIMLPKIFNRNALALSLRMNSFLKQKMVQDYTKMVVDWTSELEGAMIHYLLESSGFETIEDLRSNALPYETWKQVAQQLDLPFCQVVDHWRYNLYPRLFSRSSVMCPALYVQLIKWVHDANIKEWSEINWEELSNRFGGVGSYFLCKCLRMLILNYVPHKRHNIFRACILYLNLYTVPDFMAIKTQHVLKRIRFNPETKQIEEIKDLTGSTDEEDNEDS